MKGKPIEPDVYHRHVMRARSTSDHFTFDRKFVNVLNLDKLTSLFLQDIINRASMSNTVKDDKQFFLCTVEYLERSLKWSSAMQSRIIQKLKGKNYIETDKRGTHGSRWLKVRIDIIEQEIDDILDGSDRGSEIKLIDDPESNRSDNKEYPKGYSNKSKERRHSRNPADSSKRQSVKSPLIDKLTEDDRFDIACSKQLWDVVAKHNKLDSKSNITKWYKHFAELRRFPNLSKERIKEVLDWYCVHFLGEYVNQAFCAASFKTMFRKIEPKVDLTTKKKANKEAGVLDLNDPEDRKRLFGG